MVLSMSIPFSKTISYVFKKVRLSSERTLNRLLRFVRSIMNFVVRLLQLFCVTLLYFSAVKSAYIPKEIGGTKHDLVSFTEVYNKSMCRPREVLVEVQQEYPDDIEHIFIPSCVVLIRCAGCCNDEMLACTPTVKHNITMEIQRLKPLHNKGILLMSFTEHTECQCWLKKDIQDKTENHCKPCCSTCSERRKRLYIQDPETCQCSCKHSEADCKLRQLELNERTCRCDKPRR